MKQVREVNHHHMMNVSINAKMNVGIIDHYRDMAVAAVIEKKPPHVVSAIKRRMDRMENCKNLFKIS